MRRHQKGPDRAPFDAGGVIFLGLSGNDFAGRTHDFVRLSIVGARTDMLAETRVKKPLARQ
jgi:hypothetical protein